MCFDEICLLDSTKDSIQYLGKITICYQYPKRIWSIFFRFSKNRQQNGEPVHRKELPEWVLPCPMSWSITLSCLIPWIPQSASGKPRCERFETSILIRMFQSASQVFKYMGFPVWDPDTNVKHECWEAPCFSIPVTKTSPHMFRIVLSNISNVLQVWNQR